jgi:hypothetical protein
LQLLTTAFLTTDFDLMPTFTLSADPECGTTPVRSVMPAVESVSSAGPQAFSVSSLATAGQDTQVWDTLGTVALASSPAMEAVDAVWLDISNWFVW